jgi:hypothetical protein
MTAQFLVNRKTIVAAGCILVFLSAIAVALNIRPKNQQMRDAARADALEQVTEAPDQLLRVVGNDNSPLRILAAKIKEVPGPLFTQLTGKTTDLATISSVPEVTLLNTADKTITKFMLVVRDPQSRRSRAVIQHDIQLAPNETYVINRELFVTPDKVTTADAQGQTRQSLVNPGIKSEKGWLEFAPRSDLFVTVGFVDFADGSSWTLKAGGEVK